MVKGSGGVDRCASGVVAPLATDRRMGLGWRHEGRCSTPIGCLQRHGGPSRGAGRECYSAAGRNLENRRTRRKGCVERGRRRALNHAASRRRCAPGRGQRSAIGRQRWRLPHDREVPDALPEVHPSRLPHGNRRDRTFPGDLWQWAPRPVQGRQELRRVRHRRLAGRRHHWWRRRGQRRLVIRCTCSHRWLRVRGLPTLAESLQRRNGQWGLRRFPRVREEGQAGRVRDDREHGGRARRPSRHRHRAMQARTHDEHRLPRGGKGRGASFGSD